MQDTVCHTLLMLPKKHVKGSTLQDAVSNNTPQISMILKSSLMSCGYDRHISNMHRAEPGHRQHNWSEEKDVRNFFEAFEEGASPGLGGIGVNSLFGS